MRRVLVAVLTLLGVVLGYAALDIADIAPGLLTTKPVAAPRPGPPRCWPEDGPARWPRRQALW